MKSVLFKENEDLSFYSISRARVSQLCNTTRSYYQLKRYDLTFYTKTICAFASSFPFVIIDFVKIVIFFCHIFLLIFESIVLDLVNLLNLDTLVDLYFRILYIICL